MALDPQIAAQVNVQPQQPQTLANAFGQVAQGADVAAQAKQRILAIQDQGYINQAVQNANGDYDQAASDLATSGHARASQSLLGWIQDYRDKAGKMQDQLIKNHSAVVDLMGRAAQSVVDNPTPAQLQAVKTMMLSMSAQDPAAQKMVSDTIPDGLTDPDEIRKVALGLSHQGEEAKDFWNNQTEASKLYMSNDYRGYLAQTLKTAPDPAAVIKNLAANPVVPRSLIMEATSMLQGLPADPAQRAAAIDAWGKTPYQEGENAAQMAQAEARKAQADASNARAVTAAQAAADLAAYHRGRLAIDTSKLHFEMGQGFGGDGTQPSPALLGAINQLQDGTLKFESVPKELKIPLLAYSHQNGLDPTWSMPLTAQVLARDQFAAQVAPQIDKVRAMAKQIDDMGLMGTLAGRWRDLASKESTVADIMPALVKGFTPEQQRLIGNFVTQADLLSTGTAMSHFGARASGAAVQNMRDNLDPKGKDLPSYLGSLDATQNTLLGYATEMPGYSASHPDAVQKLKDWDAAHGVTSSASGATGTSGGKTPPTDTRPHATGPRPPADKTLTWDSPTGPTRYNPQTKHWEPVG